MKRELLFSISLTVVLSVFAFGLAGSRGTASFPQNRRIPTPTPTPTPPTKKHVITQPRPVATPKPPNAVLSPGTIIKNQFGMEFVYVPAGQFYMGSDQEYSQDDAQRHSVKLTQPFFMGRCEVTQAEWEKVMNAQGPGEFKEARLPVEGVSWDQARGFTQQLSARGIGVAYRLPTEAEWEYCARAGDTKPIANNINEIAWCCGNSGPRPHEVGAKKPNSFGLYDMLGNVLEWCSDFYDPTYYLKGSPLNDPRGPDNGTDHVLRGGCLATGGFAMSYAYRFGPSPDLGRCRIGFRVVAITAPKQPLTIVPLGARPVCAGPQRP